MVKRGLIIGGIGVVIITIATIVAVVTTANTIAAGNVTFTSAFFNQIRSQEGNLFFSPLSVEILLAVVCAGAGGKTATQIQQVVKLAEAREKSVQYYGHMMESFLKDDNITLRLANAIFVDKNFTIKQDFLDIVKNGYKADAVRVNFENIPETENIINHFVAKNTGYKITHLFAPGSMPPATVLILLNTIYFKGDWVEEFEELPQKRIFHVSGNKEREVDFMQTLNYFKYGRNAYLDAQIVEIPYMGNSVSMILVVPNTINGLSYLESRIFGFDLNEWSNHTKKEKVFLTMPKFTIEQTINLNNLLINMGISDLFDRRKANLSRIADQSLVVSRAIQRSFIEVNEKGTEAAAVSALEIHTIGIVPVETGPYALTADRPFLFFLNHKPTGYNLFMGRLASP